VKNSITVPKMGLAASLAKRPVLSILFNNRQDSRLSFITHATTETAVFQFK
jgi:hypothetical protein